MAELLLEKGISATSFDPHARDGALPERASTVVVGAGVAGASVAYHLAGLGQTDVLLLERMSVASGTSWHAAGNVTRARFTTTMTEFSDYSVGLYSRLGAETGVDVGFYRCGSVTVARTEARLQELRYLDAVARHQGIPTEMVGPEMVPELWPLAVEDGVKGAMYHADDGVVNPGMAALAMAKGAYKRGVTVREGVQVTGIRTERGRVTAVETDRGVVQCEQVVLACGQWTRDLAAACGASVPLSQAEHLYVHTEAIEGAEQMVPVLRDYDAYYYIRHIPNGLLVGAFEPRGKPIDPSALPPDWAFGEFEPDWERFGPVYDLAKERVPALRDVGVKHFLNAPESFTPDTNFCLGETAEVQGLYVSAGFNSQGILYSPGAGRALAEWIVEGAPTQDVADVDVRRFARQQSNRRYLGERMVEGLGRLFAMHWPHLQVRSARNVRRTALHDRVAAAGAVFGEMTGWERANWYAPEGVEGAYQYAWGRQNWFEHSAAEHHAARDGVALFDLSPFSKFEVAGPDALSVLQRVCTQQVDVAVGRVVYTLMLNSRGGIENDGTVTRLAEDRFLVIMPSYLQHKSLWMLKRAAAGTSASVFDTTAGLSTIAIMGPRSRELLGRLTRADISNAALPWRRATELEVGRGYALCLRVSFVGELGYELYPTSDYAVDLYDQVVEAGADLGLRHAGYHALDSLRCEKGYRHVGHDVGPVDDPYQAALGFTVALDKPGGFVGREALAAKVGRTPDRRQVYVRLDDPEPLLLHGESLLHGGEIVGRVTSSSYGHTLGAACGLAYVGGTVPAGSGFIADCAGVKVPATISDEPFYDPQNLRLRS